MRVQFCEFRQWHCLYLLASACPWTYWWASISWDVILVARRVSLFRTDMSPPAMVWNGMWVWGTVRVSKLSSARVWIVWSCLADVIVCGCFLERHAFIHIGISSIYNKVKCYALVYHADHSLATTCTACNGLRRSLISAMRASLKPMARMRWYVYAMVCIWLYD